MAITATITDYVNLAFGEEEPAPPFCKPFGSLGRAEKMARLKDLEDAGYNRWAPAPRAKTAQEQFLELLLAADDATLDQIGRQHPEVLAYAAALLQ